jgi:hypothetical protein
MSTSKYDIKHAEQSTIGDGAVSQNNVYTKTGSPLDGIDLVALASELSKLRQAMKSEAGASGSSEQDAAIGQVAAAEKAAASKDPSKAVEALKGVGSWTLSVAEKIGVAVAAAVIKQTLGL